MKPILYLTLLALLTACYEDSAGCLDPDFANYDVNADVACDGCCEAPSLRLQFDHRYGDDALGAAADTFYVDGAGNAFRIDRIRMYLSDIAFRAADGTIRPALDTVAGATVGTAGDTVATEFNSNLVLLDSRAATAREVGSLRTGFELNVLQFTVGVGEPADRVLPTGLPSGHPLGPQPGRMYLGADSGYVQLKVELFRDTTAADTVPLALNIIGTTPVFLDLGQNVRPAAGFDLRAVLEVNYARLFSSADVRGDEAALRTVIVGSLTEIFTLRELISE